MPLRGKTKRDILLEFRHAEILEAARKVFAEKGYSSASVEDIAHCAGVAKGTLYLYYPSKNDIYREALKRGLEALCTELEKEVRARPTCEAKVRAFLSAKLTWFEENRDLFKIYYAEYADAVCQPPYRHRDFRSYHLRQVKLLAAALHEGISRKEIRNLRAEAVALAILDIARGMITQRLLGWAKSRVQDDIDLLFDLTWKGLACR